MCVLIKLATPSLVLHRRGLDHTPDLSTGPTVFGQNPVPLNVAFVAHAAGVGGTGRAEKELDGVELLKLPVCIAVPPAGKASQHELDYLQRE